MVKNLVEDYSEWNKGPFFGNEVDYDVFEDTQRRERVHCNWLFSLSKYVIASLELSVLLGALFGLLVTLLWWIELNLHSYCFGEWDDIPLKTRHRILIVESVKAILTMLWPLQTVAPVCSWSMIKESNLLFWCIVAGFSDATDRLSMFVLEHYDKKWKSYIGNGIFLVVSFIIFYKFAKHRQQQTNINGNRVLITFKLMLQLVLGMAISLCFAFRQYA